MAQHVASTAEAEAEAVSPPPIGAEGCKMVRSSRSHRIVDVIATGLAKIAVERSLLGIYRKAVAAPSRLPSVAGVAVMRRNERDLLTSVHSMDVPMEQEVERQVDRSLTNQRHRRWIASHTAATGGPRPFRPDGTRPWATGGLLGHDGQPMDRHAPETT